MRERPYMDDPHFGGYPYSPCISCERHLVGRTATTYTVLRQLLQWPLLTSKRATTQPSAYDAPSQGRVTLPSYAFNPSGSPPVDHRSRLGGLCNIPIILLTLCECSPERLPCLVEYLKATPLFPRPYPRFTSHLYNIYMRSYHLWLPLGIPFGLRW